MKHRQMEPQQNVFSGQDRDVAKGAGGQQAASSSGSRHDDAGGCSLQSYR